MLPTLNDRIPFVLPSDLLDTLLAGKNSIVPSLLIDMLHLLAKSSVITEQNAAESIVAIISILFIKISNLKRWRTLGSVVVLTNRKIYTKNTVDIRAGFVEL
ncbi:hypothetical protein P9112_004678 [Eukaryota sp. TZLM1-RC]